MPSIYSKIILLSVTDDISQDYHHFLLDKLKIIFNGSNEYYCCILGLFLKHPLLCILVALGCFQKLSRISMLE